MVLRSGELRGLCLGARRYNSRHTNIMSALRPLVCPTVSLAFCFPVQLCHPFIFQITFISRV
jgi:hypothetical protein